MFGKKLTRAKTPRTIPTRAQLAAALVIAAASSAHAYPDGPKDTEKKAPSKTTRKKPRPAPSPPEPPAPHEPIAGGIPPSPYALTDSFPGQMSDAGAPSPPYNVQDGGAETIEFPENAVDAGLTGEPPPIRDCNIPQTPGGVLPPPMTETRARGCCGTSQSAYASRVDLRALAGMACALALATGRRRTKPKR